MILHQHVLARNPEVVENCISVILILEAVFGADVTELNAFQWFQGCWISNGHQKRVDSILFSPDDELGKNCGMVGV